MLVPFYKYRAYWTYLRHPAAVMGSHETCRRHTSGISMCTMLLTIIKGKKQILSCQSRITLHQITGSFFVSKVILKISSWLLLTTPPVPIWLQPLCRGDGLSPKPFRHAIVSWSDVAPRSPCTPVPITATSRIYLHCCQIYFCRLSYRAMHSLGKINEDDTKEKWRKNYYWLLAFKLFE